MLKGTDREMKSCYLAGVSVHKMHSLLSESKALGMKEGQITVVTIQGL